MAEILLLSLVVFIGVVIGILVTSCRTEMRLKRLLNGCPYHAPVAGVTLYRHKGVVHEGCPICKSF